MTFLLKPICLVHEKLSISALRSNCIAVLEYVEKTKKTVMITRFGEPFVEIGPPSLAKLKKRDVKQSPRH